MQKGLLQPEAGPGGLEAGAWWGRELSTVGLKTRNGTDGGLSRGAPISGFNVKFSPHHNFSFTLKLKLINAWHISVVVVCLV